MHACTDSFGWIRDGRRRFNVMTVVVELPEDACVHRQLWMDSGWAQEIQCDDGLENKTIPEVLWEFWIASGPD